MTILVAAEIAREILNSKSPPEPPAEVESLVF